MSLKFVKETLSGVAPVFQKVFELFTGGFSFTETHAGNTLPAGSLVKVDEAARTARVIKSARLADTHTSNEGTAEVEKGHFFAVGDYLGYNGATSQKITAIAEGTDTDTLTLATGVTGDGFATLPTGTVFYEAATFSDSTGAVSLANAITAYDTTTDAKDSVTVLRRGTAYKDRIQAHTETYHLNLPETIQLSTSK